MNMEVLTKADFQMLATMYSTRMSADIPTTLSRASEGLVVYHVRLNDMVPLLKCLADPSCGIMYPSDMVAVLDVLPRGVWSEHQDLVWKDRQTLSACLSDDLGTMPNYIAHQAYPVSAFFNRSYLEGVKEDGYAFRPDELSFVALVAEWRMTIGK